jgi:nitrate reductase gamma subunit
MFDLALFVIFPYVAAVLEIAVSFYRYFSGSYKFSSLSSEFLEGRELFWGSQPWHYGIMFVLIGHVVGFLFPRELLLFNEVPVRRVILEVTALTFGLMAFVGLLVLLRRRFTNDRVWSVTTKTDIFVLVLLLIQTFSGIYIAITYRWGTSWYAAALVPYLRSLFVLKPQLEYISPMPWVVKLHVTNAFCLIAVLPFTRLVHFLVLPIEYIWRPWQVVIWNWNRKTIRKV